MYLDLRTSKVENVIRETCSPGREILKPVLTAPAKFYHHQLFFFFVSCFKGPELAQLGLVTTNHHEYMSSFVEFSWLVLPSTNFQYPHPIGSGPLNPSVNKGMTHLAPFC